MPARAAACSWVLPLRRSFNMRRTSWSDFMTPSLWAPWYRLGRPAWRGAIGSFDDRHRQFTLSLNSGEQKTTVIPDDYFMLDIPVLEEQRSRISRSFVEIDRRTVTGEASISNQSQRDWTHKVQAYLAYYHSDAHKKRYGSTAGRVI